MESKKTGSVVVIGGGISGMLSALDLANSVMAQLDKTFPTNDCAM